MSGRTLGQLGDNLAHLVFEADLEDAIRFVDDERAQVGKDEAGRVLYA
jgi:hypothetical protein